MLIGLGHKRDEELLGKRGLGQGNLELCVLIKLGHGRDGGLPWKRGLGQGLWS